MWCFICVHYLVFLPHAATCGFNLFCLPLTLKLEQRSFRSASLRPQASHGSITRGAASRQVKGMSHKEDSQWCSLQAAPAYADKFRYSNEKNGEVFKSAASQRTLWPRWARVHFLPFAFGTKGMEGQLSQRNSPHWWLWQCHDSIFNIKASFSAAEQIHSGTDWNEDHVNGFFIQSCHALYSSVLQTAFHSQAENSPFLGFLTILRCAWRAT